MTIANITQLTNNSVDDINAQISDSRTTYSHESSNSNTDIFYALRPYFSMGTVTNSFSDETNPDIANQYVTWQAWDGNDWEIYRRDLQTSKVIQITNNSKHDINPQIEHWGDVVYTHHFGSDNFDIHLYDYHFGSDTGSIIMLADTEYEEIYPDIALEEVTWQAYDGNDWEIYHYNSYSDDTTQITNNSKNDINPQVSDSGDIVYIHSYGTDNTDIYLSDYEFDLDSLTGTRRTIPLAESTYNETNPDIAGNYVTWQAWDGNDWEIYRYDIETENYTQITNNSKNDINPQVSDLGYVVWEYEYSSSDTDIYAYDGVDTVVVANSSYNEINPQIDYDSLTWQAFDGNDFEIYTADIV